VSQRSGLYPRIRVDDAGRGVVCHAGGTLLTATIRATGLDRALSAALAPWRSPLAIHDPAKVLLDLAVALGLGGDCLADIALLRAEPGVYGLVASDPTVSRTIDALAKDAPAALTAIHAARAIARERAWTLAGQAAPDAGIDIAAPVRRAPEASRRATPWSPPCSCCGAHRRSSPSRRLGPRADPGTCSRPDGTRWNAVERLTDRALPGSRTGCPGREWAATGAVASLDDEWETRWRRGHGRCSRGTTAERAAGTTSAAALPPPAR